jgi:hypothetical protein
LSYKQFVTAAQDRLTSSSRDTIQPPGHGIIEYARDGSGLPALVSHPLFGGFDVGLGVGRKFLGPDFSIIAPSRFGYLGSTLPTAALPADQADAFAAVLDTLDLARVVVLGLLGGRPAGHPVRAASSRPGLRAGAGRVGPTRGGGESAEARCQPSVWLGLGLLASRSKRVDLDRPNSWDGRALPARRVTTGRDPRHLDKPVPHRPTQARGAARPLRLQPRRAELPA